MARRTDQKVSYERKRQLKRGPLDYKELVVKSFRLVWRHKWLWVFGLFAGGGGGGGNFNFNPGSQNSWKPNGADPRMDAFVAHAGRWVSAHIGLIILLAGLLFLFFFVLSVFSIISQGALISAADSLDKDEETSFGRSFSVGLANFWSVIGFGLLLFLIILAPIFVIGIMLAVSVAAAGPFAALLFIPLIFLGIPAVLVLGMMSVLGLRIIVIDGQGAASAVPQAWRLLWRRIGPVIITWLINMGLAIAFGLALVAVLLLLAVPVGIAAYLAFRHGFNLVKLAVFVFIGLVIFAVFLVAAAAFGAYQSTYWTLAYRQLKGLDAPTAEAEAAA